MYISRYKRELIAKRIIVIEIILLAIIIGISVYKNIASNNAMATMDKEPVSEDLEIAGKEWLRPQLDKSYANYGETKMMELTHFDGYAMLDAIEFGTQWQKDKLIEKACEWLKQNVIWGTKFIERFKKYMEE